MQPSHLDPGERPGTWTLSVKHYAAAAVLVAALVGLAGVYGIGGSDGNAPAARKCGDAPAMAARLDPFVKDEVAAFRAIRHPHDLSEIAFGVDGRPPASLAAWKGRVVLLNVWATWCPPCRAEMPALDRLQSRRAHHDFEVVAVSVDKKGPEVPKSFLREIGAFALRDYADPSNAIVKTLKGLGLLSGLPTTVLIDRRGCALGTFLGPAEWDGKAAVDLIDAAIALKN